MSANTSISGRKRLEEMLFAGYPLVLSNPPFRALFLVLLFGGSAFSMSMAYTSVWASETFNIGPQAVAMVFVVNGVAGVIGNPLLGLLSDRLGWRRRLIAAQLAVVSLAYLGYTQVTDYSIALVLVALTSFSIMGLVLAMVNDLIASMPGLDRLSASRIVAAERVAWSMGIIIGPVIAAAVVSALGSTPPVFVAAALIQVATIGLVFMTRAKPAAQQRAGRTQRDSGEKASLPSLLSVAMGGLLVAMMLVMLPTQARTMFLPLFVTTVLGEPPGMVGPLFTVTATMAVVTMPYVGEAANRFGSHRILYIGALVGFTYCVLQAVCSTYTQALAVQLLIGFGIALWSTSGLIYLQQLMPGRAGAAGGLYVAAFQVTPIVGGLLLGPIAESYGISAAFAVTAALSLAALVLLARAHRALTSR